MLTLRILEILWKVILHEANYPDRKRLDVIFKLYKMSVIIKLLLQCLIKHPTSNKVPTL